MEIAHVCHLKNLIAAVEVYAFLNWTSFGKFSTPTGQWGEGALFWCSKWTLAIFIGDIVTNSAFTIGDYEYTFVFDHI